MGRVRRGSASSRSIRVLVPLVVAIMALAAGTVGKPVVAASPSSGTVDGSAPVSWDFAPVGGLTNPGTGATDSYRLTVQLPQSAASYYAPDVRTGSAHAAVLRITLTWTDSSPDQTLGMSATDSHGNSVGNDTTAITNDGSNVNILTLQQPENDTYTITAFNQLGNSHAAIASHAVATLQLVDLAAQPQPPNPSGGTGFDNYHIPISLMPPTSEENAFGGRLFGEPSIGVYPLSDPLHDEVMYQAGLYTMRGTFDDSTKPATAHWTNVSPTITNLVSEDAILFLDRNTGRTFVSELVLACSLGAVSDNNGRSWTPAPSACQKPAGVDHETIGGGPYAPPLPPHGATYPDAEYYCSQNIGEAECALSIDGGLNYGPASVMWGSNECFGLHGHVKVAPNDGTVYVPNKACGHPECLIITSTAGPNCHPGFAVSTDMGATQPWTVYTINDMHTPLYDTGDPSIGIGAAGTMYFGFNDRDGHPKIAVCKNHGASCSASVDVSGPFHIESSEMPTVVAGDDNRAAFAFLGSTTPGDDQEGSTPSGASFENKFVGTWHLYVAVTYDGGAHWTTSDATPDHPVQRGCIEFNGSCPNARSSNDQRNLLDFNDLTIDGEGRILAAYTDGCQMDGEVDPPGHGTCLNDATRLSGLPTEIEGPAVARQSCGLGLYARYDSLMTPCSLGAAVPEAFHASALGLGAIGILGVSGVVAWRRRRRILAD